jgi:hypothetical protein
MNMTKLTEARDRLEMLYWDCHHTGGPDLELLCILRLVEEAAAPGPEDEEAASIIGSTEPPPPAA